MKRKVRQAGEIAPIIFFEFCACPEEGTLTEIDNDNCFTNMGQIQRIGIQLPGDSFDADAEPATDILLLAPWQAKMTAVDEKKIVLTPMIGGDPVIEPGEPITEGGGGNDTLNGVEEITGINPSVFSCVFKGLSAASEKQLSELICRKRLVVYFFLQGGRLACREIAVGAKYTGFAVQSIFSSDRGNQGLGTSDTVQFRFSLPAGWSKDLVILKPVFNPFVDL